MCGKLIVGPLSLHILILHCSFTVGGGGRWQKSIEVLNTDSKQWYTGSLTPIPWYNMMTAVAGDLAFSWVELIKYCVNKVDWGNLE